MQLSLFFPSEHYIQMMHVNMPVFTIKKYLLLTNTADAAKLMRISCTDDLENLVNRIPNSYS